MTPQIAFPGSKIRVTADEATFSVGSNEMALSGNVRISLDSVR
jgi:lipopolysaccharide export system protein LptA